MDHEIKHFLEAKHINNYEFLVPDEGFLALTLEHCMGLIDFGYSQNYDEFVMEKYEF